VVGHVRSRSDARREGVGADPGGGEDISSQESMRSRAARPAGSPCVWSMDSLTVRCSSESTEPGEITEVRMLIVNPGFFRTQLLTPESATYAELAIDDYAKRRTQYREWFEAQNGRQTGDPTKLAQALLEIAGEEQPPRRFIAGNDAVALAEQKIAALQAQVDAYRDLSTSLAHDDNEVAQVASTLLP
jgi:hypothetical protein